MFDLYMSHSKLFYFILQTPVKRFKSMLLDKHVPRNQNVNRQRSLHQEFQCYLEKARALSDRQDVVSFWKQYGDDLPALRKIAQAVHGMSPTSAACERAFSQSGIFVNSKSSRIHPERVKRYLFVKEHFELLRED